MNDSTPWSREPLDSIANRDGETTTEGSREQSTEHQSA